MKINTYRNTVGMYMAAALLATLSGLAIATTSLTFGNAVHAFAIVEHVCMVYQTFPAQTNCTVPVGHSIFLKV